MSDPAPAGGRPRAARFIAWVAGLIGLANLVVAAVALLRGRIAICGRRPGNCTVHTWDAAPRDFLLYVALFLVVAAILIAVSLCAANDWKGFGWRALLRRRQGPGARS